jgi:hypothetical protein
MLAHPRCTGVKHAKTSFESFPYGSILHSVVWLRVSLSDRGDHDAPTQIADESRSEVDRLLAPMLEPFDATLSAATRTEPQNEELRRLTALALIVYVTGDGIRR